MMGACLMMFLLHLSLRWVLLFCGFGERREKMNNHVYVHTPSAAERRQLTELLQASHFAFDREEILTSPFPTRADISGRTADAVPRAFIAAAVSDHMISLADFQQMILA